MASVDQPPSSERPHTRSYSPSFFYRKEETERDQILVNPFRATSAVLFIKGITIWTIWPSILFFTGFATLIILIHKHVKNIALSPVILTVLGTVIGFVVSYRTSSAYERYNDGRKQWSSIILGGRTLARLIWLHCPNAARPVDAAHPPTDDERLNAIIEKKTIINLIEGFGVSLKHYLRGEHGIYYEDLYHLACFLPKYAFPAGHPLERPDLGFTTRPCAPTPSVADSLAEKANSGLRKSEEITTILPKNSHPTVSESQNDTKTTKADSQLPSDQQEIRQRKRHVTAPLNPFEPDQELLPAYNPPQLGFLEVLPFLSVIRSVLKGGMNAAGLRHRRNRKIHDDNVPLEIIWYIDSYIALLQQRKVLDVPTTNALLASILSLSDALTTLERILTTPIPFGYIVHLKLVIWGYLFFLPFQLVAPFGYITIPAVALVSIAFLGFLRVGEEIENPFGYDLNDLDMDHFCHQIIGPELSEITAWAPPDPTQFIFSSANIPLLAHRDVRSGAALAGSGISADELQSMLRTRRRRDGNLSTPSVTQV
ncbi:hypothetical protein CROQUDRAFT_657763 [Cronartium quercuum f. sp. fusiforme G11]|uniref:Uncharacterized protein n=1 Tax=Cronartium quercuum f. sp. fusiforme G11 TaxID=708437 RepID=A0A9P6NL45_9BASI|nr:hypothetical protein CROQUDRAFT_657763 [Cronartium quercuum f. sp. fusiforme G11]